MSDKKSTPNRRANAQTKEKTSILRIVHFSDFHFAAENRSELQRRAKAFIRDVEAECPEVDLAIFAGDLAYSGKADQFEEADSLLFDPLQKRLHVARRRIVIVAGNHDVDRDQINSTHERGLRMELNDTRDAEARLDKHHAEDRRLAAFYGYQSKAFRAEGQYWRATIEEIKGLRVGIAELNSAMFSHDSNESGKLFVTAKQINQAADALSMADLRIAVLHHPSEWLHESEHEIAIPDLKRQFHLILTGHLHSNISLHEISPASDSIRITSPALFNEKDPTQEGYNIYEIDYAEKKLFCRFRKFVRTRMEFDRNIDHSKNGEYQMDLPVSAISGAVVLVQRLGQASSDLTQRIREQLRLFQESEDPIIVTTKLYDLSWKNGNRMRSDVRYDPLELTTQNSFIYGGREAGKTMFFTALIATLNGPRGRSANKAGLYLNYREIENGPPANGDEWDTYLRAWHEENAQDIADVKIVACFDDLPESSVEIIERTIKFCEDHDIAFLIGLSNIFRLDTLAAAAPATRYRFLEIGEWGPSRIREFTRRYFSNTEIDVDAAYSFVRRSLENTDLPANPVIVSLYLSVFPSAGSNLSSVSFVSLLERLEAYRLDSKEKSSTYSLYNKREVLMRFAKICFDRKDLSIPNAEAEEVVKHFFDSKLLEVDISKFMSILEESKIIRKSGQTVDFSYYVFYDFYLAKALAKGIVDVRKAIGTLDECIAHGDALSHLAGILREDTGVLQKLVTHLSGLFPPLSRFTLKELDNYVNEQCDTEDLSSSVDDAASRHLRAINDYEAEDPDFEESKKDYHQMRRTLGKITTPDKEVELLGKKMNALRTFYNIFRNLENIDGSEKVRILDLILDYHIQCNLDLIRFFQDLFCTKRFSAVGGYLVTFGGQVFLTTHLGNQSLRLAMNHCADTTDNNFKKLLLLLLSTDLRLAEHIHRMDRFMDETTSSAALELIYAKARELLITYDGDKLPASFIALFKKAYERRQAYYGAKPAQREYSKEFDEVMKNRKDFHWKADSKLFQG